MTAIPSSLALASIADGAAIIAADHRNNYANVQTLGNALVSLLAAGSAGQVLTSDGAAAVHWGAPTVGTTYRKTTAKTLNTSVAETDLLNGEFTLAANDLGTNRVLRLSAHGDWLQNSGAGRDCPRFKLKLGSTVLLDTNVTGSTNIQGSATRYGWWIDAVIAETGATNSQSASIRGQVGFSSASGAQNANFATGAGTISTTISPNLTVFEGWGAGAKDGTGTLLLELAVILPVSHALCEISLKDALVVIE